MPDEAGLEPELEQLFGAGATSSTDLGTSPSPKDADATTRNIDHRPGARTGTADPAPTSANSRDTEAPTTTSGGDITRRRSGSDSGYVSLGHTAARHAWLIAAVTVIGLLLGVAVTFLRPVSYTAEARIVVGTNATLANVEASAGLPAAEVAFASEYARLMTNATVTDAVAAALGRSSLPGTLSATPIPNSPIIDVDAGASTPSGAVRLAQVGAEQLVAEINKLNDATSATVQGLLTRYEQVEISLSATQAQIRSLQARLASTPSGSPAATALNSRLATDQATADADQLEAAALSSQFQNRYSPYQQAEESVTISSAAASTGSNRKKTLEIAVLAGLVGGLVIGLAIAALRDIRRPAPRP